MTMDKPHFRNPFYASILCLLLSVSPSQGSNIKGWKKHVIPATNDAAPGQASRIATAVAHDFDKNGQIDVISSYDGKVFLYQGPDWKAHLIVKDLPLNPDTTGEMRGCLHCTLMDGDGDMDYIGSNRMLFWLECPSNPFEDEWKLRMINYDVNGAHCVITADIDGDKKPELVANSWRDVGHSKIPNSLTFLRVPENPLEDKLWKPVVFANGNAPERNKYFSVADVNGDGRPDMACAAQGVERGKAAGWFAWWEQPKDPDEPWKKHVISGKEEGSSNIIAADLNQDGHMDFAGCHVLGKQVVWFKGPDFKRIELDTTLKKPHSLAVADMNGDGHPDIICSEASADGYTVIYVNDDQGKGNFTRQIIGTKQGSYDIRILDMDGDKVPDILLAGASNRNIVWYRNPMKSGGEKGK